MTPEEASRILTEDEKRTIFDCFVLNTRFLGWQSHWSETGKTGNLFIASSRTGELDLAVTVIDYTDDRSIYELRCEAARVFAKYMADRLYALVIGEIQ